MFTLFNETTVPNCHIVWSQNWSVNHYGFSFSLLVVSVHFWLLKAISWAFLKEREREIIKETGKQRILNRHQKSYFLGCFSVKPPVNQCVWRRFEAVPSIVTRKIWVESSSETPAHNFCVSENNKHKKNQHFCEMLHPPPYVPSSHLGSPHASAKAISCGFASYTVTTSETLASNFHFIPSIRDIQWYSVRPNP